MKPYNGVSIAELLDKKRLNNNKITIDELNDFIIDLERQAVSNDGVNVYFIE
jgi:hypothetical protein